MWKEEVGGGAAVAAKAPPLSSLSGRVRDRTSEGGEIKLRAALLVTFIYLLSMLSFTFASPCSSSSFVQSLRPEDWSFRDQRNTVTNTQRSPSLVLACEHCTPCSVDIVFIIVSLDNRLAFSQATVSDLNPG